MTDKVIDVVDSFKLPIWEKEVVLDMVEVMTKRFFEEDRSVLCLKGLEEEWEYERNGIRRKGFVDLWGWETHENGDLVIIDYKTTKKIGGSKYDLEGWYNREIHSDQLERYAHGLIVKYNLTPRTISGEIRGISVKPPHKIEIIQRELNINAFDYNENLWSGVEHAYRNKLGFISPWPKNMPQGCYAFGPRYPCEFMSYCTERKEFIIPEEVSVEALSRSHSSDKELMRCPERLRLLTISRNLGIMKEESEEATLGKAFHAGMKEVYGEL